MRPAGYNFELQNILVQLKYETVLKFGKISAFVDFMLHNFCYLMILLIFLILLCIYYYMKMRLYMRDEMCADAFVNKFILN